MKKKLVVLVLSLTILSGLSASFAGNYDEWGPIRLDSVIVTTQQY